MTQFSFSTFTVTNGTAVPTWPHDTFCADCTDIYKFTEWAKSHTYATNAPDDVWPKERFGELEWQYWATYPPKDNWYGPKVTKWYKAYSEDFANRLKESGYKIRQYIPFLEQPEPTPDKQAGETYPDSHYQPLFDLMSSEFGLTLLETDMTEIINTVNKMQRPKGETVEEAMVRIGKTTANYALYESGFKEGAQWQSTQSYSREEVEAIVEEVLERAATYHLKKDTGIEVVKSILLTEYKDLLKK